MTKIQNILAARSPSARFSLLAAGRRRQPQRQARLRRRLPRPLLHALPDSPGVRKCMRSVGRNLSQGCISALVGAGEVSKSTIEKKVAAK